MKHSQNRWLMGGAIGLAAIAIALDHTRHKLPEPKKDIQEDQQQYIDEDLAPCGLGTINPCGLD